MLDETLQEFRSPVIGMVSLGDISSLLNHPSYLLKYIMATKKTFSPDVMLYAPGVPSFYFPLLSYLGIDLFDFTFLTTFPKKEGNNAQIILEYGNVLSAKFS